MRMRWHYSACLLLLAAALLSIVNISCHKNKAADNQRGDQPAAIEYSESDNPKQDSIDPVSFDSVSSDTDNGGVSFDPEKDRVLFDPDKDEVLGRDGDTIYFSRADEEGCSLYAKDEKDSTARRIALFPHGGSYYEDSIVDFGICGDWIIVRVGHYEGSGNYFAGDFARLRRDGSELERFWLTESDTFIIAEDWIYYNYWTALDDPDELYGCYRIRPDGTEKEYMGDKIYDVFLYAEDGYLYGKYNTEKMIVYQGSPYNPVYDLIRCRPDGSGAVTLFYGETLPQFDNADYMKYYDVNVEEEHVTFTVFVHGYSEGDSWRGHGLYEARYQVNKDGSGLILLNEEYMESN